MIERIEGIIEEIIEHKLVVKTPAISLGIITPSAHNYSVGSFASLFIYLHWNQETGPSLYGFATPLDRALFTMIISCSGIGPKLAVALLHELGASGFIHAITNHDDAALSKVSGIGAKKAEQIVVQLKHKINKLVSSGIALEHMPSSAWYDIEQALISLHYSRSEISGTLDSMKKDAHMQSLPFDQLLRRALACITRKQ